MLGLFAATTTTEVPRIVGDPLPSWIFWGSGIVLLLAILAAGWFVRQRTRDDS